MSGFEVAGIVLGSLPLIISAIEHYESNLDRVRAFWKWEDELEKAIRELWIQHSSYELTLRNLLKEVASPAEIDEMMGDFQNALWSSKELSDALETRLQTAYGVYVHTIKEMESYMLKLVGHLDIDRKRGTSNELEAIILANRPVQASTHSQQFQFKRRIKLTMKKKEIRSLLKDIQSCNERLDRFIAKADKLDQPAAQASTTWRSTLMMSLQKIQEYAISLHHALSRVWTCSTQDPHQIYLLLEHRMVRKKQARSLRQAGENDPVIFTISLQSPSTNAQHPIEIRIMEEIRTGARVKFQDIPAKSENLHLTPVKDLCSYYCNHGSPISALGFNIGPKGKLYGTYQPSRQPVCPAQDLVSLEDLLSKPAENTRKRKPLSDEDRYLLAVTLTSSLLQLHTTPWLGGCWCKKDILFSETPEGEAATVDVRHPIVLNSYGCAIQQTASQGASTENRDFSHLMQDNSSLLTLAKVLLEIKLNDRFEIHQQQRDLGTDSQPNEATDIQTLLRWMTEEKGNLSFTYRDVVSHCIKCSVDPSTDLSNLAFRQSLIDRVVVPLLDELHYWQGGIDH